MPKDTGPIDGRIQWDDMLDVESKSKYACARDGIYKRKFGISIADYNAMFDSQGGRCAICECHQSTLKKALCVDHCHLTNKVRGLLCDRCNTGLGRFKDDPLIVSRALEYLSKD